MYMNQLMAISKADNGYVITVTVPLKEDKACEPCVAGGREKVFVCYDETSLTDKIAAILPLLTAPDAEEQMEQIFKEASANE